MPVDQRIRIVADDASWAQALAARLALPGLAIEVATTLAESSSLAGLCVLYTDAPIADVPCPTLVVVAAPALVTMVEQLQKVERVIGVVAPDLEMIAALAQRVLAADGLGIVRLVDAKTPIHTEVVGDARDKARCQQAIGELTESSKLAPSRRVAIDQCVDEMLMNALYDAPVDERGDRIFDKIPARERTTMRTDRTVVVHYALDGANRFVVAVRDGFGSIDRVTIVRYLHKSLHASVAVDTRVGGAGLGLYLMTTAATAVVFHVIPGVATEVVCVFAASPQLGQLAELAIVVSERGDRPLAKPASRIELVPRRDRKLRLAALGSGGVALAAIGVLAWAKLTSAPVASITIATTPGATVEIDGADVGVATDGALELGDVAVHVPRRVTVRLAHHAPARAVVTPEAGANRVALAPAPIAELDLDSVPSAANIEIDGKAMGTTPLHVTGLPAGNIAISIARPGFVTAIAHVRIPDHGTVHHGATLLPSHEVRVHVTSNPPGAAVVRNGERLGADRSYTPIDLFIEPGQAQHITLIMPGYAPFEIAAFTAAAGDAAIDKTGELVPIR